MSTTSTSQQAAPPKKEAEDGDWQIDIDGTFLMRGDETLKVVFFNLNGRNFNNPEPWRKQTHPEYLEYMTSVYPGCFRPGQTITLRGPEGSSLNEHTF